MKPEFGTAELLQRKSNLSPAKQALLEKWLQGQAIGDATHIPQRPADAPLSLSFPQQRQLFLELLEPGTAVNNLAIGLELNGKLEVAALEQSANQIMMRHEALRTRFDFGKGLPVPEILPSLIITLPLVDLQEFNDAQREAEALRLAEWEVRQPFDLTQAPLLRLKLFRLELERHFLLLVVHHAIGDGWSLGVFLRELITLYQAITTGTPSLLPELAIQYADFVHWQRDGRQGEVFEKQLLYWKEQLRGELPVLELPLDHVRPARQTFSGGTHRFEVPVRLTQKLKALSRQEDVSLFMTLFAAFKVLLYRYSGQDEIGVGTPSANRNRPELENLIGVFINTLVLRTNLSGEPSFRELLERVREICLAAYAHHDLPFEKLVEELKPPRDLSRSPLFQVMFNLQNSPLPELEIPGLAIRPMEIDRGVSQFDLTLMMTETEGKLRGTVEYNSDLFEAATIAGMFGAFCLLLEDAAAHPDRRISRLQILAEAEQHRLILELNQTQFDYPFEKCVHELFAIQAEQTPDAVAVIFENASITYRELHRRANVLAKHLQKLGVEPEVRVGIYMERSLEMVLALLGVLQAGGVYVPISPSLPAERVRFIMNDANVRMLLTNLDPAPLGEHNAAVIKVDHNDEALLQNDFNPKIVRTVTPNNLAYVIYTSGSTGQPKGVMIPHRALVNFLWSMRERPGIGQGDVLLAVTAISFDIAALELFLPLITGATVLVSSKAMTTNPPLLQQAIRLHHVNLMQATPATWQMLLDAGWSGEPNLKALCGGETWSRKLADQLLERVGSLWNMYGPTETTVWSAVSEVKRDDTPITIGGPIANTQLYVLDRYLQPVPAGGVGELHISGAGLARGYLHQPKLTAERFIPDPFSLTPPARMYKTGDRARYLPDGSIELLGRWDDQVKIHGHRIELGEIAAVLLQHPALREAVVIAKADHSDDKRLVAYFVSQQEPSPNISELQQFIRKRLPDYMVPAAFVPLHHLPMTSNGKVNRRALPEPQAFRPDLKTACIEPRTDIEKKIAGVWKEMLHLDKVGIHDNFFDLGGHSLLVVHVQSKLREILQHELPIIALFEYPTINALAKYLSEEKDRSAFLKTDERREKIKAGKDRLLQQAKQRQLAGKTK